MHTKKKRKRPTNLYHPRYWPSWAGVGMLRILSGLPPAVQRIVGRWAGRLLLFAHPARRKTVAINLAVCWPELSDQRRARLTERCFESLGLGLCETATAWWHRSLETHCSYRIEGLEHITAALRKGRGVLLCSAHLHTAELAGRLMTLHQPITIVFRPQNDLVIERVAQRRRASYYGAMVHYRDMRGVVAALRRNEVVWYAPDIDAGTKRSVFVPFFGVAAASLTATARLARVTGASVVPCFFFRRENGMGYDIEVSPALEHYPSGNMEADAACINTLIERAIRRHPEQYLWQHRRFKTRPAGEPPLYPARLRPNSAR